MSNEFEPYPDSRTSTEFSVWDYKKREVPEEVVEVDPQEQLMNEVALLKQDAFDKGYAEGLQQAQEEINARKTELMEWIAFFQTPIQLLDEQLTQEIIQTLIWLCQHCIGIELSVHPEKFHALFDEIRSELPSLKGSKTLGLHPLDVDWVKAEFSEKELPGIEQALFPDPSLVRGDFYLKSEHSDLDGRLQTRLMTLFAKYIKKDTLDSSKPSED
ncbi:flagellar assembly protein FliH [uncultured Legionella sp.]|uniref:flagellar assembly protein FliH n=1 Tax=uncultured Legionella sp. TaxID=210934 RepID=UPI002611E8E2|nr:flagellar assembly protein FliH [uncultured Legionella sp.]